jgi:REP element-mobilizing transposase RayT
VAYVKRIEHYRNRYRCIVYAYVLTSNHVHLLIETGAVGLSKISPRLADNGDNGVELNNLYNLERS